MRLLGSTQGKSLKSNLSGDEQVSALQATQELKDRLAAAQEINWGVIVDGYLSDAAVVGNVYAASLYLDRARMIQDGETVVTPPVQIISKYQGFTLLKSCCGQDHYVIVSEYGGAANEER